MNSSRYEILPRLRKMNQHIEGAPLYKCTWKDTGKLRQDRGKPLQYVNIFVGIGNTPDEAIKACRMEYLDWCCRNATIKYDRIEVRRSPSERFLYGDGRYVGNKNGPDISLGPSDTIYRATSNLPWWKRLFRV